MATPAGIKIYGAGGMSIGNEISSLSDRMLKNYCAWQYGVKILLNMLIYCNKLRFFVGFCLVLPALMTFFNTLFGVGRQFGTKHRSACPL